MRTIHDKLIFLRHLGKTLSLQASIFTLCAVSQPFFQKIYSLFTYTLLEIISFTKQFSHMHYLRREFLFHLPPALGTLFLSWKSLLSQTSSESKLTFGLLADAHQDIMHDAEYRLEAFMKACEAKKPDFVLQLGDFCFPIEKNKPFMQLWNQYKGPRYHVLGNHDMDVSSKAQTREFWEMPDDYYSFDQGDFHFVVLDANFLYREGKYEHYDHANFYVDHAYRTFVHPEQIEWLAEDLRLTDKPTFIFSHQSLYHDRLGVKNRLRIQRVLEKANREAGYQKVVACFNGHNHIDFHRRINDIHYIDVNSLSYFWLGEKYENKTRYETQVYEQYPSMAYIAPYKDPLYAFITIDPVGKLNIEGLRSAWVAPSPKELGIPQAVFGSEPFPYISDRQISYEIP